MSGLRNRVRRWLVASLALLVPLPGVAQWKAWDYDLDQEKRPWDELQAQLPAYPKPENLLRFDIGSSNANRYFIDAPSLSVGEDGVVRYSLVIRAAGGATNVSFEGVRCESGQVRVYAFGHPDQQWSRARNAGWRDILQREINGYHHVLMRDYFCTASRRKSVLPLRDIESNLKNGPKRPTD